jgi:hypothetical protein
MLQRHLFRTFVLVVLVPSAAAAQWSPPSSVRSPRDYPAYSVDRTHGYDEGHRRGMLAGSTDARRGAAFNFAVHVDFRRGDAGYRAQFGARDRYRYEFRRAFELGYRAGYGQRDAGYYDGRLPGTRSGPAWPNGRAGVRVDVAHQQGHSDGYEAGFDDARDRRRFDPVAERRYRAADRGYNKTYGPRDRYAVNYRTGFLAGYEAGYAAAARSGRYW